MDIEVARRLERLETRVTLLEQRLATAAAGAAPAARPATAGVGGAAAQPAASPVTSSPPATSNGPAAIAAGGRATDGPPPAPLALVEPSSGAVVPNDTPPASPSAPSPIAAADVPALEPAAETTGKPTAEPTAAAAPQRPARGPFAPAAPPRRRAIDLERFFGLAVMGRIGIAAVVLAATYFAQLGWGRLGPVARVCGIYAAALAMIGVGAWLRPRAAARYIALLWGGGVSLAYVAGVAAKMKYELIGGTPALLLLVASAAMGQWLARVLRLEVMALVALVGAFAAPVLVGDRSAVPTGFFVYLIALHTWAAWTEHAWDWRNARRLAVVATELLAIGWFALNAWPPATSVWLHVEGLWLALAAPELLAVARGIAPARLRWPLVVAGAAVVQVALLAWSVWQQEALGGGIGAGLGLLALAALLLRRVPTLRERIALLADVGAATLAMGVWIYGEGPWQLVGGSIAVALAVLATRRWTAARDLGPALGGAIAARFALDVAPTPLAYVRMALTFAVPIALVRFGAQRAGRLAGLWLGALIALFAVRLGDSLQGPLHLWAAIAWVPVAAWLGWCFLQAKRRECGVALQTADALLHGARVALPLAALWAISLLAGAPLPEHAVPALALAGLGALALGAAAHALAVPERLRAHARELVELGGLLAVLAGYCAWPGAIEASWPRLATLVAIGGALLGARRWLGGGELAIALAAAFGIAVVAPSEPSLLARLQMALIAVLPTLLVWRGRAEFGAPIGAALGAIAAALALRLGDSLVEPQAWWLPAMAACAIAWATVSALLRPVPNVVRVSTALRALTPWTLVLPVAWLLQALRGGWVEVHAASGTVLGIGVIALAIEAWRVRREATTDVPTQANDTTPWAAWSAHGLADLGAVLAVLGVFALPNAWRADGVGFDQPWLRLGGIAVIAAALFGSQRWTRASELAPGLAAAIAAFVVLAQAPCAASRAQAAIAIALAAALVLRARQTAVRAAALGLAASVAAFAATRTFAFAGEPALWTSIGLGVAGGIAALGALLGGWRRDRVLLTTAALLLALLGVGWSVIAWQPVVAGDEGGLPPFVNLRCLCALLLVGLLDFARRKLPADAPRLERGTFVAITLGFAYLAGLVEMLALVRGWPAGWSDVTISLYTVLFAAGLLLVGFRRQRPPLRYAGLGGFAIVIGKVALWDLADLATPLRVLVTGVLGVVLLLGAWAYARNRGPAGESPRE